jgi:hypothetical protein
MVATKFDCSMASDLLYRILACLLKKNSINLQSICFSRVTFKLPLYLRFLFNTCCNMKGSMLVLVGPSLLSSLFGVKELKV